MSINNEGTSSGNWDHIDSAEGAALISRTKLCSPSKAQQRRIANLVQHHSSLLQLQYVYMAGHLNLGFSCCLWSTPVVHGEDKENLGINPSISLKILVLLRCGCPWFTLQCGRLAGFSTQTALQSNPLKMHRRRPTCRIYLTRCSFSAMKHSQSCSSFSAALSSTLANTPTCLDICKVTTESEMSSHDSSSTYVACN